MPINEHCEFLVMVIGVKAILYDFFQLTREIS